MFFDDMTKKNGLIKIASDASADRGVCRTILITEIIFFMSHHHSM